MSMQLYDTRVSPRHSFLFREVPTVRGSMYGGSVVKHYPDSYGPILDSVYEMTRDVGDANNVPYHQAIETVLRDECWRLLPKHKKAILARLDAESRPAQ